MDNKNISCQRKKTSIGGQALMEGIMMRGPGKSFMAVRDPDGNMVLEECIVKPIFNDKIKKIPVVRGLFNFIESMAIGYKCLMRSADISAFEEIRRDTVNEAGDISEEEKERLLEEQRQKDKKMTGVVSVVSVVFALALSVLLFIYLPAFLFDLCFGKLETIHSNGFLRSLFEGVFKMIIVILYMWGASQMKDIKRTFMYHGAEHKTIFCYEAGLPLTVENVRKMSRFHPRCGTSFLAVMIIVGVLIGLLIPTSIGRLWRTLIKLLLLPVTMGLGYEFIKYAGRHDNLFIKILSAPGLWFQRISTKEPDDSMIECAIASLEAVIPEDNSDIIK